VCLTTGCRQHISSAAQNPWKDYFTSLELRRTIQKDVERTFPDVDYFRSPNAQRMLADILFVYSKANDTVSYRQGMHELLAPVLWALDYDSLEGKGQAKDEEMYEFLSRDYVPADAWAIFSRIMNGVGVWYEWREPVAAGRFITSIPGALPIAISVGGPPPAPWVAPINEMCSKIGGEYLIACDPVLGARMNELEIEPQMYGMCVSLVVNHSRSIVFPTLCRSRTFHFVPRVP
jgi:TBC1 domain family member 5